MDESQEQEDPENFLFQASLIDNLRKLLDDVSTANQMTESTKKEETVEKQYTTPDVDVNDFIVTVRSEEVRSSKFGRQSKASSSKPSRVELNPTALSFINQIDCDEEKRTTMRREREKIANNFRSIGNYEYRINEYKRAIYCYTKGLESIKDTPVLYCSRALCFAKLRDFHRALFDLEYVLNKLDPNCLQAWLYRAAIYMRMHEPEKSQASIHFARERNTTKQDTINDFISRMQADF